MLKRKGFVVVAALAAVGAISMIGVALGATTVTLSQSDGIAPKKLPKKKYKPGSLNVVVDSNYPEGETPVAVTHTQIDFDDDGKITTRGLPICNAPLAGTTTDQARQACRSSFIGRGRALAIPPGGTEPITATVSAFNGPKQGGNPTILLHSDARPALPITLLLQGRINPRGGSGSDYGARLTVPVDVPPGTILTRFETTVEKKWRHRGRQMSYITARCNDGNKTLNMKGRFELAENGTGTPTVQTASDSQKCKVQR
jgi:hypothetical protein